MNKTFKLPKSIVDLLCARDRVRDDFNKVISQSGSSVHLDFTLDGNLVGDIGEAMAVWVFGVSLVESKSNPAVDGFLPNGRSVQVKATGTGRGPAFRKTGFHADDLIFFDFNWRKRTCEVVFNGPEIYVTRRLPSKYTGQKSLTSSQIRLADNDVMPEERLIHINH